jgi:hypothetical protein
MASEEERESGEGPVLRRPNSHRPGEEDGRGDEAELRVSVDEEVPLLRKPTSNQGTDAGGWEGSADFDGLRWWRTPSVSLRLSCYIHELVCVQRLINLLDLLAITPILPLYSCIRWYPRP